MPPGDVQAFDARTGEKVWEFHTIPQEGEYGNETWENEAWKTLRCGQCVGDDDSRRGVGQLLPAGEHSQPRLLRRPSAPATTCSASRSYV